MFRSHSTLLKRAFSLSLMGSLLLSFNACQNNSVGQLRFQIAIANSTSFAIQAIPSQTDSLRIEVTGEGLSAPMTHTLTITKGETSYRHEFSLPIGKKEVKVTAYQGNLALAQGNGSASISASQSTPLSLMLQPVAPAETEIKGTRLTLQGIMPIEIPLNIKISGEGLDSPLNIKATLPAGVNSSVEITDTKLPVGEKTLELRFITPNSDLGERLPTISQAFTVSATENTEIVFSLEDLLQRYREQIKGIPSFLNLLRQYAPQLLPLLGPLPEANPIPAPTATVAPSPSPATDGGSQIQIGELITPSPTPSPLEESSFLADVRLAFERPEAGSEPFASEAQQDQLALSDQSEYTLTQKQVWGILVRTRQLFETSANPPEYVLQIKDASGKLLTPFVRGTLNRSVTSPSGVYRGGLISFKELEGKLTLEANSTYTVDWVVFSPGTNQEARARYTLKTP